MKYFNTDKLTSGKEKAEEVFDAAELLGLNVIRVTHKNPAANPSGISGFEVPKLTIDGSGMGNNVLVEKGYMYVYPDKVKNRHGFLLDTDANRSMLKAHLATGILTVADEKLREELIEEATEAGLPIKPNASIKAFQQKSFSAKKAENTLKAKQRKIEEYEARLRKFEEDEQTLKDQLALAEKRDLKKNSVSVEEKTVDEETGEIKTTEVPAEIAIDTEDKTGKTKQPKTGKALSGKKTTRKK